MECISVTLLLFAILFSYHVFVVVVVVVAVVVVIIFEGTAAPSFIDNML